MRLMEIEPPIVRGLKLKCKPKTQEILEMCSDGKPRTKVEIGLKLGSRTLQGAELSVTAALNSLIAQGRARIVDRFYYVIGG